MSGKPPAARRSGGLPIHVVLVDDHPAVRYGIRQLLATQCDLHMLAEAASASEALAELAPWADVAVVDYHLGDRDGLWLTQRIKQRSSPPPVLIYSAFADTVLGAAALIAGADGLLRKTALAEELCIAIRRLFHGRHYFPAIPESTVAALRRAIEPRDQAIFSMLIDGARPSEVRARLGLSAEELQARREAIVSATAPSAVRARLEGPPSAPLDYDRRSRRPRYPAAG
jgi:DNA-binding NarL/FixJ family response regulator